MVQLRHLPGGADCSMLTRQAQHKQSKIKFLRKYQISINIKRLSYHKSTQIWSLENNVLTETATMGLEHLYFSSVGVHLSGGRDKRQYTLAGVFVPLTEQRWETFTGQRAVGMEACRGTVKSCGMESSRGLWVMALKVCVWPLTAARFAFCLSVSGQHVSVGLLSFMCKKSVLFFYQSGPRCFRGFSAF